MAVQPWKGSQEDWAREHGFWPEVLAESGAYVLRRVPAIPESFQIALRTSEISGVATIERHPWRGGWQTFCRDAEFVGSTPGECWQWWLARVNDG